MASWLSTGCNFDITPPTIARAMVTPIHHATRSLYSTPTSARPIHHNWDGSSYHWNTATTRQCRHCPSPLGLQHYPLSTSYSMSYSYKPPPTGTTQLVNFGAISNGEEYSSQMKVDSVFRQWLVEYGSDEDVNVTQICDGERLMGWAKASWFGEPSGWIIKLDLLSFRILAQVEAMASWLCGISVKSFDFTLCPILDVTSITCSSRTMPAPTLPEPPETFSSSTTSKSCHGLPSVQTCTHTWGDYRF